MTIAESEQADEIAEFLGVAALDELQKVILDITQPTSEHPTLMSGVGTINNYKNRDVKPEHFLYYHKEGFYHETKVFDNYQVGDIGFDSRAMAQAQLGQSKLRSCMMVTAPPSGSTRFINT